MYIYIYIFILYTYVYTSHVFGSSFAAPFFRAFEHAGRKTATNQVESLLCCQNNIESPRAKISKLIRQVINQIRQDTSIYQHL